MVTKVGLHDANEFITLSHGGIARFLFEASVAPDGSFEFLRIPQGKYKLSTEPVLTSWIPFPFAVSDSDVMGLDLVVPLESRITVTVTVDDNIPLPPVTVSFAGVLGGREAQRPSAEVLTLPVRTYPNRTLYTALQAGEHRVVVSGFPSPYFVKSITAGARNLLKEPLLVEGIGPLEIVVTLALPPGNTVKVGGRVILPPGFSLTPSQTVSLYVPRSDTSLQAAINPDGTFEFAKVQRGEYEATLRDL
jgi:hypothetical protein